MNPRLVLLRHGNTFSAGEKVVMVGATQDLPLTEKGIAQAQAVGESLRSIAPSVVKLLVGPLKRTVQYGEQVKQSGAIEVEPVIDQRLIELDYGAWGGLSNEEIERLSGAETLKNWQQQGIRPAGIQFAPSEDQLRAETESVLAECALIKGTVVVVTSNGRLREYARLIGGEAYSGAKVKTGHSCLVELSEGRWKILGWDMSPDDVIGVL